ncbi:hypothetical protein BGZ65_006455, partial [Modicella reniformis]
ACSTRGPRPININNSKNMSSKKNITATTKMTNTTITTRTIIRTTTVAIPAAPTTTLPLPPPPPPPPPPPCTAKTVQVKMAKKWIFTLILTWRITQRRVVVPQRLKELSHTIDLTN